MNLNKYKDLIESNPLHIATVNKDNKPNLSVASDVRVLDDNTLIISCNEMVNTQENIKTNSNVVITSFDDKWVGVRLSGTAKYYTEGKHYDFCKNTFFG
ncbi:MAG: pyridoxamine 5'-phosphate oxidase family protein, partial [Bacilli bacterium]|nr:pyridoxamine 5'-phosphate oxidase family protein [Bacilli bacterium]